jgi:hypothetical protein
MSAHAAKTGRNREADVNHDSRFEDRLVPHRTGKAAGRAAPCDFGQDILPFCGDEYPPLKGSPGAVVCTKPPHPDTELHVNEETGWVWRNQ